MLYLLLITLGSGIFTTIIITQGFLLFKNMKIRRRFSRDIDMEFSLSQGILSQALIYFALTIGENLEKINISFITKMSNKFKTHLSIIGNPYNKINPYFIIGIQALLSIILCLVCFFGVSKSIIAVILFMAAGIACPVFFLNAKIKIKYQKIFLELPDILDLLTLMVEAGLDFSNAINKITDIEQGELAKELTKMQQETKLGKSRIKALSDMSERLNYPIFTSVINSIILSLKTGASMGPTLRVLSQQFREERMQHAEKMAAKAPIKLMFPLILFIFPTVFIVLFGPIALSFFMRK